MSMFNAAKLLPAPASFEDDDDAFWTHERPPVEALKRFQTFAATPKPNAIRSLLVTGGTGFIGGAVLAELYGTAYWPRTLMMVRASDMAEARARLERSLARFFPDDHGPIQFDDDQIVLADLKETRHLASDSRIAGVTHVIHSAAVTAFSDHPRIRAINVDASLDFVAMLSENTDLKRFVNVGTAWCVGMRTGELVREMAHVDPAEHAVPYTASKIEFEREVRERFPELPFVSARPSIVVGHTELGTKPSGSIYWVFRSGQALGQFTCSLDDLVDVVPVDWVAKALVQLVTKDHLAFDTYHLSAGREYSSSVEQLDRAIAEGLALKPHGRARFKKVDDEGLMAAVIKEAHRFGDVRPRLLARALCLYGRFAGSGVLFDNTRTLAEGIEPPPPFFSYAGKCAETAETSSLAEQMEDDFK